MSLDADHARADRLRESLRRRDDEYERSARERSSMRAILADETWLAEYDELKALELALAGERRAGFCAAYVKRKRRWCAFRARDGGTMCTLHRALEEGAAAAAAAAAALARDVRALTTRAADEDATRRKKKNMNRRMKKMTNPLAVQFQTPKALDDAYWRDALGDVTKPAIVDVGTAKGGFIKELARDRADACSMAKSGEVYNVVGVEIYEPLVRAANAWVEANRRTLKRAAHFVACNANVSLKSLNIPNVRAVCVQFPDPWSRARHVERRVMTPEFARAVADILPSGGELYCCSDVKSLAEEMYDVVAANADFALDEATYARVGEMDERVETLTTEEVPEHDSAHKYEWKPLAEIMVEENVTPSATRRWLRSNPYDAHTERDIVCEQKIRPVYRFAVIRR